MQTGEEFEGAGMAGNVRPVTARGLVLHPATHEFHHKRQSVTQLRQQGHPESGDYSVRTYSVRTSSGRPSRQSMRYVMRFSPTIGHHWEQVSATKS